MNSRGTLGLLLAALALACLESAGQVQGEGILGRMLASATDMATQAIGVPMVGASELYKACRGAIVGAESVGRKARDPDENRNVTEIIRSRGFLSEEYDVHTRDGYILTVQRIVNPLVEPEYRKQMKPVILQHGLMSSSVDWVINSLHVRPEPFPARKQQRSPLNATCDEVDEADEDDEQAFKETQEHPNSLGYYLANRGYDVWLANSRGNTYGQRHERLSNWNPLFWRFTFDEQIDYDLPAVIEFVQNKTNHTKLGYVGHSQGTAMVFGLLSDKPEYADILEPVVALAPVAFANHATSPAKRFSILTYLIQSVDWWFATSNAMVRALAPYVCSPKVIKRELCENIFFLSVGFDEEQLDESRLNAYLTHMPSGTSVKNIAHWGQMVNSGRFSRFDHGLLANLIKYGTRKPPSFPLDKIRSKSLVLMAADNDWLASPKDVARLRRTLTVQPMAFHNLTEYVTKWNHIDFLYGKSAGQLVNTRVEDALKQVENMI